MTGEEKRLKFVIVGEAGVGKTSLMQVYSEGSFCATQTPTVGSTCTEKEVMMNNQKYSLSIWDTAGQETYRSIVPMYFRGAALAIVVCDVTSQKSLDAISFWFQALQENLENSVVTILCANKTDLTEDRKVDDEQIQMAAQSYKVPFYLTSAATGAGVNNMFESGLAQVIGSSTIQDVVSIKKAQICMC